MAIGTVKILLYPNFKFGTRVVVKDLLLFLLYLFIGFYRWNLVKLVILLRLVRTCGYKERERAKEKMGGLCAR